MRSLRTQISLAIAVTVYGTIAATCILSNVLTNGQFYSCMREHMLPIAGFSLLFAVLIGHFLARRISSPVMKSAALAQEIAQGKYGLQIASGTKTKELSRLVAAVNHLGASLSRQETLRKQLTADVAHELRTPLTTLGSHLEAMLEGVWEPTPARLESCHEEILRLGKIVEDLEGLARADGGNLRLELTEVDLLSLAQSVCRRFEGELAHKKLRLTVEGEGAPVLADKDRISGVLVNLLSNAVKYTPEGGHIRVRAGQEPQGATLTVEDDGAGIPPEELPFIFERFYRADKSRNRATGGAGIGLAIVQAAVQAHGGGVCAQNGPNGGSRFVVTLPRSPAGAK
jgi:signal transduction histidine kinase